MNPTSQALPRLRGPVLVVIHWTSYVFLLAGLLAAAYAGHLIGDAHIYQAIEFHRFDHRAPLSEPHVPIIGEALGEIEIPRLTLKAVILHGNSSLILRRGVAHLPETAMPGEWGNVVLAGHRDTLFRSLRGIRPGDVIRLRAYAVTIEYTVESIQVVSPTNVQVLEPSNSRSLTLITCFPFEYVGPAPNRFIVHAEQTSVVTE
ncbi:MAG TPA: class D sortase [Candidatus Acidoferrum sp.]|nr:class D sortase [Candidatus Acidoferrum sp.]